MDERFKYKKILGISAIVIAMLLVLKQAATSGNVSHGLSYNIAKYITDQLNVFHFKVDEYDYVRNEMIIRKIGHFVQYYTYTTIVFIVLIRLRKRALFTYGITLLLSVPLPFIDEIIQLFIGGRSGQLFDVMIDLFAVFWALVIGSVYLFGWQRGLTRDFYGSD